MYGMKDHMRRQHWLPGINFGQSYDIPEHVAIFEYPICCLARPSSPGRLPDVSSDALQGEGTFSQDNFILQDFEVIFCDRGFFFAIR
jgi:hypothetical protein